MPRGYVDNGEPHRDLNLIKLLERILNPAIFMNSAAFSAILTSQSGNQGTCKQLGTAKRVGRSCLLLGFGTCLKPIDATAVFGQINVSMQRVMSCFCGSVLQ